MDKLRIAIMDPKCKAIYEAIRHAKSDEEILGLAVGIFAELKTKDDLLWTQQQLTADMQISLSKRIAELGAMVQNSKAKSKVKKVGIKCPFKLYRSMDNCGACLHAYSHFWDSKTKLCTPKPKEQQ